MGAAGHGAAADGVMAGRSSKSKVQSSREGPRLKLQAGPRSSGFGGGVVPRANSIGRSFSSLRLADLCGVLRSAGMGGGAFARTPPSGEGRGGATQDHDELERNSCGGALFPGVDEAALPVPEGRQRKLAGGKPAAAGAAPGEFGALFRAPAGHRRNWWQIWRRVGGARVGVLFCQRGGGNEPLSETPRAKHCGKILRCPAGARDLRPNNRGRRPLARTCPRLISGGVPPGRGTHRSSYGSFTTRQ